jgi:hypothetical protein
MSSTGIVMQFVQAQVASGRRLRKFWTKTGRRDFFISFLGSSSLQIATVIEEVAAADEKSDRFSWIMEESPAMISHPNDPVV